MSHRLLQFNRVFYFYLPAATLATPSTVPSSEENASQPSQAPFLSFSHEDNAVRRENGATEEGSRANGNRAEDEGMSTNIDIVIRLSMPPDGQGNQNHATTEELVPFLVSQIQQLLNNAGNAQTVAENPGNAQDSPRPPPIRTIRKFQPTHLLLKTHQLLRHRRHPHRPQARNLEV